MCIFFYVYVGRAPYLFVTFKKYIAQDISMNRHIDLDRCKGET